jgi:large subunit ribosomal protein L35
MEIYMPKLKTKSAIKKRFKMTASGKLMRKHTNKNHILTKKNGKRIRKLRKLTVITPSEQKRIEIGLPYGL